MKSKKILKYIIIVGVLIGIAWTALTLYVEADGPSARWFLKGDTTKTVLVIFDPDPFYNLDQRVCMSFAQALSDHNVAVTVATVSAIKQRELSRYGVIVFCANTYNWRPDWSVSKLIHDQTTAGQHAIAITLGAGSTESSQRHLEKTITNAGAALLASYSLWLWRPNDETNLKDSNVKVAETNRVRLGHSPGSKAD